MKDLKETRKREKFESQQEQIQRMQGNYMSPPKKEHFKSHITSDLSTAGATTKLSKSVIQERQEVMSTISKIIKDESTMGT